MSPRPTVADTSSAPKEVSPQVGKFATIPAIPQQRSLVAEVGPPTRRRKWRPSLAAAIIVLSLVSGGALMLMGRPIEIAQDAYRSAVAEMQRLTARENAETEAAARKAAEEKALAKEAARVVITAWQKTQGLPETGYLTEAQLATLRQQAAAALSKYDQAHRRVKEDPRETE